MASNNIRFKIACILWFCCMMTLQGQKKTRTKTADYTTEIRTELIVEKGELLELSADSLIVQKIVVRGTLRASDKSGMVIVTQQIEIDGGRFEIGSKEKPRTTNFELLLKSSNDRPGNLLVKNKGQLVLNGILENVHQTFDLHALEIEKIPLPTRYITIATASNTLQGFIEIEDASDIYMSGVLFKGLGIKETKPALSWFGTTSINATIEHSVFTASKHTDLYLDKTKANIQKNTFVSLSGSSISCAASGVGSGNKIYGNTLINRNGKGLFALVSRNPFQTIVENELLVRDSTNGIGLLLQEGYQNHQWPFTNTLFELNNNTITAYGPLPSKGTIGMQVDAFDHKGIWRSTGNRITNFSLGAISSSKNLVLKEFQFQNNTIGIIPGVAYLQNSTFKMSTRQVGSTAIWIVDKGTASAPKVSDVAIENYAIGFHIEGKVDVNNYFEKISYKEILQPIKYTKLHTNTVLFDKDRSFSQVPLPPSKPIQETSVSGHHHGGKSKHKGIYLFPSTSSNNTKNSTPLPFDPTVYYAPVHSFGVLTIATGFGLEDPVHEHSQRFNSLFLKNRETQKTFIKEDTLDNEMFFLAAYATYEFEYGAHKTPLYDLSFEWDAPEDTWIMLRFKYTHPNPQALRSFGSLIKPAGSMHDLMHQNETSYFYDPVTETVLAKIYNHSNRDELVIYSSDVLTEIIVDGRKIPISIYNEGEKIIISYDLPKEMSSILTLNDHYGNPIKTLHEGNAPQGKISTEFDLKEFDVRKGVFLYFLTVDNQTHKGPVYAY